jgi:AraC family transcriptional regulator
MIVLPESTSPEAFDQSVAGRLIAASKGWKDLLVRIYSAYPMRESSIVPGVAEPFLVQVLSGAAVVEERELGGPWLKTRVEAGDFFLTASPTPYELRWKTIGPEPFGTMHLHLGLPVFTRAIAETFEKDLETIHLRDVSGFKDTFLAALLEGLRREVVSRRPASPLFVQGVAQALAVHLVRNYSAPAKDVLEYKGGLPGFKLRKITELMAAHLDEEFSLVRLAREADMSEFHFSRLFKRATGLTPSQYFIHLRMEKARRLLRETNQSVIEIGLDVGYTSPSHFAQIFRREVGISPSEYRRQPDGYPSQHISAQKSDRLSKSPRDASFIP